MTICCLAKEALDILRERRDGFDIVISDVNMPDMDGFKLLEYVGLEMDLPVISKLLSTKTYNQVFKIVIPEEQVFLMYLSIKSATSYEYMLYDFKGCSKELITFVSVKNFP